MLGWMNCCNYRLDIEATRIEEYKLDFVPFLDPTLPLKNRDLRQYSSTPTLLIYTQPAFFMSISGIQFQSFP